MMNFLFQSLDFFIFFFRIKVLYNIICIVYYFVFKIESGKFMLVMLCFVQALFVYNTLALFIEKFKYVV